MLVCRVRDLPLGHSGQQGLLQRCSLVLTLAQPEKSDDGRVKRCSLNAMCILLPLTKCLVTQVWRISVDAGSHISLRLN